MTAKWNWTIVRRAMLLFTLGVALLAADLMILETRTAGAHETARPGDDIDLGVQLPVEQQIVKVENTEHGTTDGSPGVLSGNIIQAPIAIPVNVCGNAISVLGLARARCG